MDFETTKILARKCYQLSEREIQKGLKPEPMVRRHPDFIDLYYCRILNKEMIEQERGICPYRGLGIMLGSMKKYRCNAIAEFERMNRK